MSPVCESGAKIASPPWLAVSIVAIIALVEWSTTSLETLASDKDLAAQLGIIILQQLSNCSASHTVPGHQGNTKTKQKKKDKNLLKKIYIYISIKKGHCLRLAN